MSRKDEAAEQMSSNDCKANLQISLRKLVLLKTDGAWEIVGYAQGFGILSLDMDSVQAV